MNLHTNDTFNAFKDIRNTFKERQYVDEYMFMEGSGSVLIKEISDKLNIPEEFVVQFLVEEANWHLGDHEIIQHIKDTWKKTTIDNDNNEIDQ